MQRRTEKTMTRAQAADALGVSPQAVSYYLENGMLGGFKTEQGKWLVKKEDVVKHKATIKEMTAEEGKLEAALAETKERREAAERELEELRSNILGPLPKAPVTRGAMVRFIATLYEIGLTADKTRERDVSFVRDFLLNNPSFREMSQKYGISQDRCRQLLIEAFDKVAKNTAWICERTQDYYLMTNEVEQLRQLVRELKSDLAKSNTAREEYKRLAKENGHDYDDYPVKVLGRNVRTLPLTVRTINGILGTGNNTLGAFLCNVSCMEEFKGYRSVGRKTVTLLREYMDEHHLVFKDPDEPLHSFYERLAAMGAW